MRYRNLRNTIFLLFELIFTDYQCYITMITKHLQTLKTRLFCLNVSAIQFR